MNLKRKCKVVMLPTKDKSKFRFLIKKEKEIICLLFDRQMPNILDSENQHLYIISDDEIKEGDWFIDDINRINKCISRNTEGYIDFKGGFNTRPHSCKKIIATTDILLNKFTDNDLKILDYHHGHLPQPSQQFIDKYIEEYNKGNIINKVLVEYEFIITNGDFSKSPVQLDGYYIPKVNKKDNTITITELKDSWNREEVITLLTNISIDLSQSSRIDGYTKQRVNNWIKDNL